MAGGPYFFRSAIPRDAFGRLFSMPYVGAGGNDAPNDDCLFVKASLDADAVWDLRFDVPLVLPAGAPKLRLWALANATSGSAKLTVEDGRCPAGSSPSAASLTSETQTTVTWASGDNDKIKEAKVPLTAVPQAGDTLVVALKFQTSGWTLAVNSGWIPSLIWE